MFFIRIKRKAQKKQFKINLDSLSNNTRYGYIAYLNATRELIKNKYIEYNPSVPHKLQEIMRIELRKELEDGTTLSSIFYLNSKAKVTTREDVDMVLVQNKEETENKLAFLSDERLGSASYFYRVISHFIWLIRYNPLVQAGNSYIPTPKEISHHNQGIINLKNYDDMCFMWCHLIHLAVTGRINITRDRNRVSALKKAY